MIRKMTFLALLALLPCVSGGCPATVTGSYQLTNVASGVLVTEFYLSPSGSASDGPNRLSQPLYPGESITITGLVPGFYDGLAVVYLPASNQWADLANPLVDLHAGQTYVQSIYYTDGTVPTLKLSLQYR